MDKQGFHFFSDFSSMEKDVSSVIVESWLKGWSLSRKVPLPVGFKSGFKVDVGDEKQKSRYVFPKLNDDFKELSEAIDEPWVFLKVCASVDEVSPNIPGNWTIEPQGYLMTCFRPMDFPEMSLSQDYHLEFEEYHSTYVVKILAQNGELASTGRVALVDDFAVYDRIITESHHQRKGLGRFLMKELEKISLSKGISKKVLVATEEGKLLYQSLGWELYSLYTSVVIQA